MPKFVGLNEFFRRLVGPFTPVKASAADRQMYIQSIGQIKGFPAKWLDREVQAFRETANVREVRQYADGVKMVRFEVMRIACDGAKEKYESPSLNLMLALDSRNSMMFYTLIYGTGRHVHGFHGWVCRQHVRPTTEIRFSTCSEMMTLVEEMRQSDFIIIEENGHKRQFIQAYCDEDREAKYRDDPLFTFEYCIHDWIWQFVVRRRVKRATLKRLLGIYQRGGIPALQDSVKWLQMNITEKNLERD